jgi:exopolysaccharide biosynthesis polyprenyl glycosylphosphotransferase
LAYIIGDFLTLNVGWLIFNIVRYFYIYDSAFNSSIVTWLTSTQPVCGQILIPLMMLGLYWLSGYYNSNSLCFKSRMDELLNTVIVTFIGMLCVFFVVIINDDIPDRLHNYELILTLFASLFLPTYLVRLSITTRAAYKIRNGEIGVKALIIGTGHSAIELAKKLNQKGSRTGFAPIGYVTYESYTPYQLDMPVYNIKNLRETAAELDVRSLIIMPHHDGMRHTLDMINSLYPLDLSLYIPADLHQLITLRPRLSSVAAEPLINITNANIPASTINIKRFSDIILSIIALIILLPFFAIIAIAIKRDSAGPIFYKQERIGYHKKPFNIIKFRTMYTDAESNGPGLTTLNDSRITKIGHFLRKYRIDEFPQFWNVLKGEMSLIGPRPEREYYIRQIIERAPYYSLIHQVRPGITSWGMVKFGYASSVDEMIERLRYDLLYIENVSIGVDLKILLHTINTVITGKGI